MSKKYLITSAQLCYYINKDGDELPWGGGRAKAVPHYYFLKGLETYCKENSAELVILPVAGKNTHEELLHGDLRNKKELFYGERKILNKNIQIRDIVVPPQNVDPATGKSKLVSKYNSSLIFAHTKQRFSPVPVFNADLPRYIYTPGAVTMPNYNTANHRGDTAERDHVFGALLVEVLDDVYYNISNIRAMKNGKFVDRGKFYQGDTTPQKVGVDFMVIGDYHWGDHDERAVKATYEMIEKFKPKRIILHDFFNGHSVNYHDKENIMGRVREFKRGRLSLEDELESDYKELMNLCKMAGKNTDFYIVSSNHHRFLPRYINDGAWMNEFWNAEMGAYLFEKGISLGLPEKEIDDGSYLIEMGMKKFGKIPERIKFLRLNSNLRIHGYQLAIHGDKGNFGSRGGNAKAQEIIGGGKSVSGDKHRSEIYGDTYIVGTNSQLDLPYAAGYGNASIATNAVCYENGLIQLLPIIEGRWMKF
ncbi:MAG: hypothetical protein M1416_03270 [Candidatus Pacearchaeota archaeon]|nr:hypothetical protein [Candidatus Pacearchaeota archaeon]